MCGWQMSFDYRMAVPQTVTSELLVGDTIHRALGIDPIGVSRGGQAWQRAA